MKSPREKQKRLVLALLVITLTWGFLYILVVQPLKARQEFSQQKAIELKGKIDELTKTKMQLIKDVQIAKAYRQHLDKIESQMPEGVVETWTIKEVQQIAQRHSLTLFSTHILFEPNLSSILLPSAQYEIYYYHCNIQSELFRLGKFLMDFENTFPTAAIESLTITSGEGGAPYLHEAQIKVSFLKKKK